MKDFVWVVEVNFGSGWFPDMCEPAWNRWQARDWASYCRRLGKRTRVRKYQRVGK